MKKSFILYSDTEDIINELSDEQAGIVIKNIFKYVNGIETNPMDLATRIVFKQISMQLDRDNEKYNYEDRETYVYYIILSNGNEEFLKIGISSILDNRYSDYTRLGFNVKELFTETFGCKSDAEFREYEQHKHLMNFKYIPKRKFGGYTECFLTGAINHIKLI